MAFERLGKELSPQRRKVGLPSRSLQGKSEQAGKQRKFGKKWRAGSGWAVVVRV